jgi:hypothetical protein
MKLTHYELHLLATAFLVLEEDMSYEQENEIQRRSNCSITDLYELADKCKLMPSSNSNP